MRKRRFALSALLIMCMVVAMILSVMPMSVLAADAAEPALTGTKLTTAHAGTELQAGEYYVEPGATLTLRGGTGKSGLKVAANSTVTIHIPAGSILNVYGGAASGTTGAGAGIEVGSTSNLKIIGSGTLNATGGKAASGSNGSNGETARWGDDGYSYIPDSGYGGAGGGGAGAGIGTKGGNGGSSTSWQIAMNGNYYRTVWTDNFMDDNYSGSNGHNGKDGASASACGGIYIQPSVTLEAAGGAEGASAGSGGSAGSRDYESDDNDMRGLAGGAGGGGGGAGKAGANIGTGGGGGGGGGAGGGIGYAWSCWFVGGGGGGGGAGAIGGSGGAWSSDGSVPDHDCGKYDGGKETSSLSGGAGGSANGGAGGSGCKVKIRRTKSTSSSWEWPHGGNGGRGGNAGSNCVEKNPQTLYTVSINNGENTTVYYASEDKFLPETLAVQNQTGYTFKGFYDGNDTQYYDANGNRTSAKITDDVTISAKLDVNEYDYTISRDPSSSGSSDETGGTAQYGNSITLATPSRDGYLFRGWKISASNGTLNQDAYYTYSTAAPVMRMMMRSSTQSSNQSFAQSGNYFMTAGAEKIGSSVTLYNLSADDGADLSIEEVWVRDHFEVTFKDFDGLVIDEQQGQFVNMISAPAIPNNTSEYYTYTLKYWKCNIDGNYYTTEQLNALNMGAFLSYESELGEQVYTGITFTAVYDIEYKKELHFVGSLGNDNLDMSDTENFPNGVLILGEGQANVPVITNFKITQNDGVAALLLIPQYDASVFNLKAISINGQLVYGNGATSSTVLNGFNVTITGTETESDMLKILLDNLTPDATVSDDIFVQIIYEMKEAVGGRYEFGFITADYDSADTDHITHGDRSEAYGTYDPNVNTDTDAWRFNELKITVDTTAINVVVRENGKIEIEEDQSFVYNGQQMSAADVTEQILNVLQFTYNGFAQKENDTLTIKWYDENGNELSEAPKHVGTYQIGISASQTTYYYAADEKRATFKITPYEIFIVAGDQTFEYTGSNIVINGAASQGGIFIKDADGNYIPVDAFVNSELALSGVKIENNYVNAGEYLNAITGILIGDQSNYTVNYINGTLTITKAVNEWVTAPNDKTETYSGSSIEIDEVLAKFGEAKVKYYVYQKDAEGNYVLDGEGKRVYEWSEIAPVDADVYRVRVTVEGTENYSGLECEVALTISKLVITIDSLTFDAIDKIYNGEAQYWVLDPDDNITTDDTEVRLIASDASLLQYIIFAGMEHPMECINAGTYQLQAILQISNPNYTFLEPFMGTDEEGNEISEMREVNECTLPVTVEIQKRKINVNMVDQEKTYDVNEPQVQQGKEYVTITPTDIVEGTEEFEKLMEIIERDFFGGERVVYMLAIEYSSTADYYYLDGYGAYVPITLTEAEFNENKALAGAEGYKDIYTKITIQPETIQLYKNAGVNAGTYALHALLGNNSNYEIVAESGNFIILKKTLDLPTLGSVIYNGQEQTHSVDDTDLYTLEHNKYIDAGVYKVLVALKDPNNYQWEVDGAQETSEDQKIVWCIEPKEITVILPGAAQEYTYGVTYGQIQWNDGFVWKDGDAPYGRDGIQIDFGFNVDQNWVFDAGTYNAVVLEVTGTGKDNYIVKYEGGLLTINKKPIMKDELAALIKSEIKYYTGEQISWVVDDFTIDQSFVNIIKLVSVGATNHLNANGIYENDAFTYHTPETKYFADVELDVINSNYKLADDIADGTVEIEVFIAKAQNAWDVVPSIDARDIGNIIVSAVPKFGTESDVTVTYFKDEDCEQPIDVSEMVAGTTYYAVFTVAGTDDYFALSEKIHFNSNVVTVKIPVVYLENGTIKAGVEYKKPYIGTKYRFDCNESAMESSLYSYAFSGDSGLINAGTYTITFTLKGENGQYEWEDGSTDPVVFTLIIERANLTIKPDDFTINYKDDAPTYTLGATGLANGETLEDLLSDELYTNLTQFSCDYTKGNNVGTYDIFACKNGSAIQDEIVNALTNYIVTFEQGTLTVTALTVDYDDVDSSDDKTLQDLINNGPSFVYDNESKEVKVENLPDELEVVVVYKDKDGNVLPVSMPKDAGKYTVEITLKVKDPADAGNYDLPDEVAKITLTINKAEITITVHDKTYEYDGTNRYGQFNTDKESGFNGYYTVTFDNVTAFDDGSEVTSIVLTQGEYVNAGIYADKITAEHNYSADNYVVTIENGDLIITKATNEWKTPLASGNNIVYDKDAVTDNTDFWSEAKFGDASVDYKFYLKQANGTYLEIIAPTNAGTYYVRATVAETSDYAGLDSGYVMLVINKDTITIDAVTFVDGEVYYNGQAHSIVADHYAELFNVSYTGNGKINAGTYTVTATFTIKDTANYELEGADSKSATLTINKVLITITANDKTSMFGNAIENLTYDIEFIGDSNYTDFYESDWGSIVLNTTATGLSDVGTYEIDSATISNASNYEVTFNKGTYTITKFTGNTITVEAEDIRYLMDLIYSAEALRGQSTVKFTFATSEDGEYTETLPKNVGTYYVKATVAGTNNYEGCVSTPVRFEIQKATLSAITDITYNKDTATWVAVGTTTDGMTIDCSVSYLVGAQSLTSAEFKATSAGNFSVIAVPSDEDNYNNSAAVTLETVYSVSFADKVANHDRQPNLADLTAPAFATQYRFAGQAVTRPTSIDSNAIPEVVGYKFREWQLNGEDYGFNIGVTANITLYADWTVIKYKVTFYNDATEDKIENSVFVPGTPNYVVYQVIEVEYGNSITLPVAPTKTDVNNVLVYTFSHWSGSQGGTQITDLIVKGDLTLYAVYDWGTGSVTITYMISVDGAPYMLLDKVVTGDALEILADKPWFIEDGWYIDAERTTRIDTLPVVNITLYGAYVFDIGAGDVNADGEIDVDDISLYRRWIVGGYNIVSVAPGSEWNLVNSDSFDTNTLYFVERVSDANRDDSGDIRDITTVRMALTGGYGYDYVSGRHSAAKVTGYGVVFVLDIDPGISTVDEFKAAINNASSDEMYIKLVGDIVMDEVLKLANGEKITINLNGHTLTMANVASNYAAVVKNGTLTIEGEGTVIVPGIYGFGTASDTTTGHIVINDGNFVGEQAVYLFSCYNGSITINDGNFTADFCVLNNFDSDENGHTMTGTATVRGGTFEVTGDTSYAILAGEFAETHIEGEPVYMIHKACNLFSAVGYGGKAVLSEDVVLTEESYAIDVYANVTIDLNGHNMTLSDSVTVLENVTLTIEGEGEVSANEDCVFMTEVGAQIVVNGGIFADNIFQDGCNVADNRE